MKQKALVYVPGLLLVVVVLGAMALREDVPPDCALPVEELGRLTKTGLAVLAVRSADTAMARAQDHLEAQDRRLEWLRRYDEQLCRAAQDAVATARAAVLRADATRVRGEELASAAMQTLEGTRRGLSLAQAFVSGGVVDEEIAARLMRGRESLEVTSAELARAKSELSALGWEGSVEVLERAAGVLVTRLDEATTLAADASRNGFSRCVPKAKGKSWDIDDVHSFRDWLIMKSGESARLFFSVEREAKKCSLVRVVEPDAKTKTALPASLPREELLEWTIPGAIATKLLVGWSPQEAWFLEPGGDFRAFRHLASAECDVVDEGCPRPRLTSREVEASCPCRPPGETLTRTKKARYVWDGHGVNAEQ